MNDVRQGQNAVKSLNGKIGEIGETQKILNRDFFPCRIVDFLIGQYLNDVRQDQNAIESLIGKIGEIGETQKILNLDFFPVELLNF